MLSTNNRTCTSKYAISGIHNYDFNKKCSDIDECVFDDGGCNQTCTDTTGSYYCSCDEGYKLNNDSHGCDGILMIKTPQ